MSLRGLPVEMLENVALFLPSDEDLANFMDSCDEVRSALLTSRSGIWRSRYADCFDVPKGMSPSSIFANYISRKGVLRKADFTFHMGFDSKETRMVLLMIDLINESFVSGPGLAWRSNSFDHLKNLAVKTGLFKNLMRYIEPLMTDVAIQTIQLVMCVMAIEPFESPTYNFPYSQQMVYSHPEVCKLFGGLHNSKVNIHYALNIVNFFKYHFTHPEEHTLYETFSDLHWAHTPQPWYTPLKQGKVQPLGRHWMGIEALATPEDVSWLRSNPAGGNIITDTFGIYGADVPSFQTMKLNFNSDRPEIYWPAGFEENLHGIPTPELLSVISLKSSHQTSETETPGNEKSAPGTSRCSIPLQGTPVRPAVPGELPRPTAGLDYLYFTGRGMDTASFYCSGVLHALPPQNGVIGWQRITFIKHFDHDGDEISNTTIVPKNPNWQPPSDPSTTDVDVDGNQVNDSTANPSTTHTIPKYPDEIDSKHWIVPHNCWAFEGVVLPGGTVMVGRWFSMIEMPLDYIRRWKYHGDWSKWRATERRCTGPFIYWNVDPPEFEY